MRTGYASLVALYLSLIRPASGSFFLQDSWAGADFFQGWTWEDANDPTHGRVNYVSQGEATQKNLSYADGNKFIMRADDWSHVDPSARGRDSVRISSQTAYDDAVFVLDIEHMPQGCSTWPAFWTLSKAGPWPHGGEIDIIEGVNLGTTNLASLHTLPQCTMPGDGWSRPQSGTTVSTNCDTSVNFNQGCGVHFTESDTSYGAPFNYARGGYYAMSKTRWNGVQVWFWPRGSPDVPTRYAAVPEPHVGHPAATFPMNQGNCDYESHFDAHQMVFDLTFCGDWAGNDWASSGCGITTCEDFVNSNPSAFAEAYWEINSLRVYTPREW
ncbi:concanavalin A-like lectin/glucanase domain-containing protein [Gloeopeniophorella convolvens]|nr:concanavalin A-like lectin/glucanase domain-containing protein [Gloeopeniophorella convolvens]